MVKFKPTMTLPELPNDYKIAVAIPFTRFRYIRPENKKWSGLIPDQGSQLIFSKVGLNAGPSRSFQCLGNRLIRKRKAITSGTLFNRVHQIIAIDNHARRWHFAIALGNYGRNTKIANRFFYKCCRLKMVGIVFCIEYFNLHKTHQSVSRLIFLKQSCQQKHLSE